MIRSLIQKEFLQIRRNAFLPRLIIMNMEVKNIFVDVVDNDRSTLSQQIVHDIEASRYFIFNGQKPTYKAALAEIEHGKADVVLVIPQHFGRDLTKARAAGASPAYRAGGASHGQCLPLADCHRKCRAFCRSHTVESLLAGALQ